ncbi:unnamed protein product [Rhizoctonia solani]|uniref:Protein kinase domain-containing protein n=1 Tax=Rhizoctonia solani TaxID=456999 RepID=A0A8H3CH58_9AGAM|nr:unnamed protein product [Rhizoctonia solani]
MNKLRIGVELNCYIIGDSPKLCTTIEVFLDTAISHLKVIFAEEYKKQGYGELGKPVYYKVERSSEDLEPREEDEELGGPGRRVGDYWPEVGKIDKNLIHVFVHAIVREPFGGGKETEVKVCEEPDDISELAINISKLRLKFLNQLDENSPSKAAQPAAFRIQQATDNYILNGRPAELTGPPIVLYHPVFGRFLRNLQSSEPLSVEILADTVHYFQTSQNLFQDESTRRLGRDDRSGHLLGTMLGGLLLRAEEYNTRPDGVAPTSNGAWCIIMEMTNEIGAGGSDPSIQAARSYSRVWKSLPGFVDRCCCPSILVAIAGPWMTILGAIFLDRPVIQPMTDFLWVGYNPTQPSNIDRLARVFYSLSEARKELEEYYSQLPSPDQVGASVFPYLTHYVDPTGKRVEFEYKKNANRTDRPSGKKELVFFAQTLGDSPTRIVVKFVTRYHSEAHRLLAKEGLAPKLLYDSMDSTDRPAPDYSMIVMEYVAGGDLGQNNDCSFPLGVAEDVEKAIKLLHARYLVFGDLRKPNIMLVKDVAGRAIGAKLIDFEWCGKHLEERYPSSMNMTITWATGVRPGALLDKAHDMEMLRRLGLRRVGSWG